MGRSLKPVTFFSDAITIKPHTATDAANLDRPVSVREFAGGDPVSLYEINNGEYVLVRATGQRSPDFIEGPEVML